MNNFDSYCTAHTSPAHPILLELERETHLSTLSPQMLSGPLQGAFLRMLSQMIQPERILEIGTFTGYAAICLAAGLPDHGRLHTIEINPELAHIIQKYIQKAGLLDKIQLHIGDAAAVLPTLGELFDLVFLDAGKLDYPQHYEIAMQYLRPGGYLLADNVLWDGKVPNPAHQDPTTQILRTFNDTVHQDNRVENLLLPLRDGIMIARKLPR